MFLGWSKDDRDKASWEYIRSIERCGSCGTRPGDFEDDPDAMTAVTPVCRGCELLETRQASLSDREKSIKGMQVRLVRRG